MSVDGEVDEIETPFGARLELFPIDFNSSNVVNFGELP